MSQINSLSSFQYDDIDPMMGRYPGFTPVPPPITTSSSGSLLEQSSLETAGYVAMQTQTESLITTNQQIPVSGLLHGVSSTQSLITALQSTMTTTVTRSPVVIPGVRKRKQIRMTEDLKTERRVAPHLRLGIALGAIIVVMITTLASLSPLGSGQNSGTLFGGTLQLMQAQQQDQDIAGHTFVTLAQANAVQATAAHTTSATANTTTSVSTTPPVMITSTSSYVAIAQQDAIANGISPVYFVNQIQAESGFDAYAASGAGAVGIAQFEPSTAAGLGVDPYNPISALAGAARLMASYNSQYNGNYAMALAAYNAGPANVSYAVEVGGANWISFLPGETQQYIYKIMGI